jgi:hypothetical protein
VANRKQPERWEASLLAAFLSIAGTWFLLDRLGCHAWRNLVSVETVPHFSLALLVVVGVNLLWADRNAPGIDPGRRDSRKGRYE